ncbi:hypothetical protein OIV83_006185 [Microbotryomycetes sp. JL201]|nr:hypothetical protein OIV83_006185 [Microbotryomycetes sp. JL201]
MATTQEALLALERRAKWLDGPLVPLIGPKPCERELPRLVRSDARRRQPFGPSRHDWTCDTFVLPAAFPRSTRKATVTPSGHTNSATGTSAATPGPSPAAAARTKPDPLQLYKALLEKQVEAHQEQISVDDESEVQTQQQLYLAVNRYKRARTDDTQSSSDPVLTLVFAHANGFHKEIWEPTMADLLDEMERTSGARQVGEIWSLDACNQGDAGVLNEAVLGETFNWADHGRDIAQFLISYLDDPTRPASADNEMLPQVHADAALLSLETAQSTPGASKSASRVFRNRLVVGVGHSLGGGGMAYAASAVPSVFSSMIFCDPVIVPIDVARSVAGLTTGALIRRERWPSKEEAKNGFLKKAFFQKWDSRVLGLYCSAGLKELSDGTVALKCRAKDEALVFCDPMANASRRACTRLSLVPASLKTHFVFADKGVSVLSEDMIESVLKTIPHATFSRVKGAGHLVAQEDPKQTAERIADFLKETYSVKQTAKM